MRRVGVKRAKVKKDKKSLLVEGAVIEDWFIDIGHVDKEPATKETPYKK